MGQRGPKPALKLVPPRGRKRVRPGVPPRPAELTGEAADEWDRLAADLDAAGLLAVVDRGVLAAYCLAVADMLAARDAINRGGRWQSVPIQNSQGKRLGTRTVEHPAVKLLDRASARVLKLARDLGLTAASRSRLDGDAPDGAPEGNKVVALRERFQAAP